jgi:hypothetical protein
MSQCTKNTWSAQQILLPRPKKKPWTPTKLIYYRRYIAKKHEGQDSFELHSRKPKFYLEIHVYLSGKAGKKNVHHHLIIIIISMLQGRKRTAEFAVEIIKQQQ